MTVTASILVDREAPVFYVKIYKPGAVEASRADVSDRVTSFSYDDDAGKADKLSLSVDNFDLAIFDDPLWKKGNFVECSWGYAGNMTPAHECVIQSIKGFTTLTIEALSKSILMNKVHRARIFENQTYSAIVRTIARENGYGDDQIDIQDTPKVQTHVSQARMTDAQFVKHLAQRMGFQFFVDVDGFHFAKRKIGKPPRREFIYYNDPGQGDILSIEVENDVTATPGVVKAKSRDPLKKEDIDASAKDGDQKEKLSSEIEVLDAESKTYSLQSRPPEGSSTILGAKDADDAKAHALGKHNQAQLATVQLSMTCVGDYRIAAKQVVKISNISKRLSGNYYVQNVKHALSTSGYTMVLKCRTDGGHGNGTGVKTKSAVNDKDPTKDDGSLEPIEALDAASKTYTLQYRKGEPPEKKP